MRIGLAQISSQKDDMQFNLDRHVQAVEQSAKQRIDLVVFPELSLTGYNPEKAAVMAIKPTDSRLAIFDKITNKLWISLAFGAPLRTSGKPLIAMLLFSCSTKMQVIGKHHLHEDEVPFFSAASTANYVNAGGLKIGFAICHEITVPEHFQKAVNAGCDLYLASVAKTHSGMQKARRILTAAAGQHQRPVLVVNCTGECEGKSAGGGSFIINTSGKIIAKLSARAEGLLIYDSENRRAMPYKGDLNEREAEIFSGKKHRHESSPAPV